jgi:hypothetical protein
MIVYGFLHLRLQIVTSSFGHGGRRYLPLAFTEHGAVMAANVLNSARAIKMSIFVVRAFVRMREMFAANQQFLSKLSELEQRIESHDAGIQDLFDIIRQLTAHFLPGTIASDSNFPMVAGNVARSCMD